MLNAILDLLLPPANEVWGKVIFLPAATKLGQGNIFTSVCQEFCPQGEEGVCLSACWDTPDPQAPRDQTPLGADTPQTRHPPSSRPPSPISRPPGPGTPPAADPPWTRHTHPPGSRLQHTVNEWPVCILLECILVAPVCHSVHRGEYLGRYPPPMGRYIPPGRYTPQAGTPTGAVTPPRQVHTSRYIPSRSPPGQVYTPSSRYIPSRCPLGAGTPPGQVHTPGQVHPLGRKTPSRAGTPPRQVHPRACTPPGAVHAGRYGQQAGGTHPTGMHSCLLVCYCHRDPLSSQHNHLLHPIHWTF